MVSQHQWSAVAPERHRVSEGRYTGWVLEWKGRFGWIAPDTSIDHPEACKHGWRVYVNVKDVDPGTELHGGARVSFLAYSDGDGVGAEDVRLDENTGGSSTHGRKGSGLGVQKTIMKLRPGKEPGGPGGGKGKSKCKDGGKKREVVLIPAPGSGANRSKTTHHGAASVLTWASSEMQGWRPAMEDASCVVLGVGPPLEKYALFGIFDGHGGDAVSKRIAQELPNGILACASSLSALSEGDEEGTVPERALQQALPDLDEILRADGDGEPGSFHPGAACGTPVKSDAAPNAYNFTGSTAVVALVECDDHPKVGKPLRIVVANCGDSRAVLCRDGVAMALSEDQKPDCPAEKERIEKAGGHVAAVGPCQRIDGWGLNLSRALGDFHYKARLDLPPEEQKVTACPEVLSCELTEDDEFLLLGCDGVFELQTSQSAVELVRKSLQAGNSVEQAVEDLVDECCSHDLFKTQGHGSDNVSALVVLLR